MNQNNTEIIIYQSEDGTTKIDVRMEDETVWLTIDQMAELFDKSRSTINEHILNVYAEKELEETTSMRKIGISDFSTKPTNFYNLDMIISVGYRVKSLRGTQFRMWATERLREYIVKGFTMNDDLLKKAGGGNYWRELLERIRDIRSSEKVFYLQLLDLFATSVDYNSKAEECRQFFQIVQNKMHYAVNKQTSAEIIYSRADAEKPFMGMKTFSGEQPRKADIEIAKNYLDEKELAVLNRMVSAFFELAELHALQHEHMYMRDWLPQVDDFAERYGKGVLKNSGKVSKQAAVEKATEEYKKYRKRIIGSPTRAERDYLEGIKQAQKKIKGKTGDNNQQ